MWTGKSLFFQSPREEPEGGTQECASCTAGSVSLIHNVECKNTPGHKTAAFRRPARSFTTRAYNHRTIVQSDDAHTGLPALIQRTALQQSGLVHLKVCLTTIVLQKFFF